MAGKRMKFLFKPYKDCESVHLAGDFTDWDKNPILMKKNKTGEWTLTKSLTPGEHVYKFIADGEWHLDPNASKKNDGFGSENSVINVG